MGEHWSGNISNIFLVNILDAIKKTHSRFMNCGMKKEFLDIVETLQDYVEKEIKAAATKPKER